jgi:phage terminase large subunit GpA-like protein
MGARDFDAYDIESISPECVSEIRRAVRVGLEPLKVEPPLRLSEWAAKHFYLSAESSQQQKKWEAYPFQPGIMDAMGDDRIEEVDVFKSARVGYTKMLLACIAYDAHHKRRNQALWQPTDDDSDDFCKTELEPMLRDVEVMRKVFPSFMAKSKNNTLQHKKFLGSILHLRGGKAAKNYRRITVASAKVDEVDGFDQLIERSSDPHTLTAKRLEGATFPKHILGSTPRVKGLSHIEGRTLAAQARMRYYIACPHCDAEHPLMWGGKGATHGFKFDTANPEVVTHVCPHCHEHITQAEYLKVWGAGAWVSECGNWRYGQDSVWRDAALMPIKPPRHVAFKIWTAYSPQATWIAIVRQFLEAMAKRRAGDKGPLQGFVNETLGETWEDDEAEKVELNSLQQRAEAYPLRTVPMGGLVLVAGVDVQGNRFEIVVWAIGRGGERWVIDYCVIPANPADPAEWEQKLDPYLLSTFPHASGQVLHIEAAAVDMMGHFTHQGYNFARMRESRRHCKVFAGRGDPQPGKPIGGKATLQDVNFMGRTIRRGVKLWYIGTDTAKDLFFGQLQVTQPGPGYVHFSKELPDVFFQHLTAEARVPVRTARGHETRWVNVNHSRNEALDCTVYSMFCEHRLALHTYTDKMWARLEAAVQPPNGDLFEVPSQAASSSRGESAQAAPLAVLPAAAASSSRPTSKGFSRDW